jgi:hypothetical protein
MLVVGFLLYRRGFDHRPLHMKFLFHKVPIGQVSLQVRFLSRYLDFTLFCIIPRTFHILFHINTNFLSRTNGARTGNVQKKQHSYGYWGAMDVTQGPLCCLVRRSFSVHSDPQTTNCLRGQKLDVSVQRSRSSKLSLQKYIYRAPKFKYLSSQQFFAFIIFMKGALLYSPISQRGKSGIF